MPLTRYAGISGFADFNPDKDIPSLQGKVIFITGGTAGLGRESVRILAKHQPAHIYFSGRNTNAGAEVIKEVKEESPDVGLTFVELDLTSLASVKAACAKFQHDRLDILMCNAGIMFKPAGLSVDGFEIHFATNHLGHAMLTRQLLPVLLRTAAQPDADVRIVNLTSLALTMAPRGGVRFDALRTAVRGLPLANTYATYGQSKLANLVYAAELARRHPGGRLTVVAVHPGVVQTELVGSVALGHRLVIYASQYLQGARPLAPREGVLNQVWAAAGARRDQLVSGGFYTPVGVESSDMLDATAKSPELAAKLWDWTEDVLKNY